MLSKTVSIYGRHIVIFTLVAGVIGLPIVWGSYYLARSQGNIQSAAPLIGFLIALFLQPLSTAIILYGAFQDMRGQPVRLGESIVRGLARFPSLLGLMLLSTLGIALGMFLLFVPGLILMIMWYVAVPASVVERTGPVGSLGRSQILTKGHRWKLFGLVILVGFLGILGRTVFSGVGTLFAGITGALVGEALWQGVAQAFGSVMVVVAYHDLRSAREGIDIESIASVFD